MQIVVEFDVKEINKKDIESIVEDSASFLFRYYSHQIGVSNVKIIVENSQSNNIKK